MHLQPRKTGGCGKHQNLGRGWGGHMLLGASRRSPAHPGWQTLASGGEGRHCCLNHPDWKFLRAPPGNASRSQWKVLHREHLV